MKKAALYSPYLDTIGGGEKHILAILNVLQEKGFDTSIFWDTDLTNPIRERLDLSVKAHFEKNIFKNAGNQLQKLSILKKFEYFFYVPDGSYFVSSAKRNYIFCMIPQKSLYPTSLVNRVKTYNYRFICNSQFTQSILKKWGISATVIYPFIEDALLEKPVSQKKKKVILSVGRFVHHLHSKKQDIMIQIFQRMKQQHEWLKDFKLVLAGGLHPQDQEYFNELKNLIGTDPSIELAPNIPYSDLETLYNTALLYWHFTGWDVDEEKNPEAVEHLGISPMEAMARGCITFCVNAGGPKEVIKDAETGFLFSTEEELAEKMENILNNPNLVQSMQKRAHDYVLENFNKSIFRKRVENVLGL